MARRIRSIKPEWLDDEALVGAGDAARVLSVALVLIADDYGRGRYFEEKMAGEVWPLDSDRLAKLRDSLASLSRIGFVRVYEVRSQKYFEIRNWSKHQRVDKPSASTIPAPCDTTENQIQLSRESLSKPLESLENVRESLAPRARPDPDPIPFPDLNSQISDQEQDQIQLETERAEPVTQVVRRERPPVRAAPPDAEPFEPSDTERLLDAHAHRYKNKRAGEMPKRDYRAAKELLEWCRLNSAARGQPAVALALQAVAGLFDSPRAAQKRWPLAYAAHDPAEYLPNPAGVSAPPSEASADEQAIRDAERRYDELIRAESDDYEREKLRFQRDSEIPRLRSRLEEKRQYGSRTKRR